jgi:hypothetical protein
MSCDIGMSCLGLDLHEQIRTGRVKVVFRGPHTSPATVRFWARVKLGGPLHPVLKTRCWTWTGVRDKAGYGQLRIAGRTVKGHRYAWVLHKGAIPAGLCVLHKCDNPSCVNLNHLWLGTIRDNNNDTMTKGRYVVLRGAQNGHARLTEKQVASILARYTPGCPASGRHLMAREFGVSQSAIRDIVAGRRWAHLSGHVTGRSPPYARDGDQLLLFPD